MPTKDRDYSRRLKKSAGFVKVKVQVEVEPKYIGPISIRNLNLSLFGSVAASWLEEGCVSAHRDGLVRTAAILSILLSGVSNFDICHGRGITKGCE